MSSCRNLGHLPELVWQFSTHQVTLFPDASPSTVEIEYELQGDPIVGDIPQQRTFKVIAITIPLYRWGNKTSEKESRLPKIRWVGKWQSWDSNLLCVWLHSSWPHHSRLGDPVAHSQMHSCGLCSLGNFFSTFSRWFPSLTMKCKRIFKKGKTNKNSPLYSQEEVKTSTWKK